MAPRLNKCWPKGADPGAQPFVTAFDLDALAGDWFASGADPQYSELPCYVEIVADDDEFDPRCDQSMPIDEN